MQIIVEGEKDGGKVKYTWDLLDHFDRESGIHSMARTTGYTATAAVRLIASGLYRQTGVSPPEYLADEENCVNFMLEELKGRGVIYRESKMNISG
jgi:saccharopine dehydrogenase-like NADP-dependent oxidoreductase